MLTEIAENKYNAVITWAPDRLSRNAGIWETLDLMDAGKLIQIAPRTNLANTPNEKFLLMIFV